MLQCEWRRAGHGSRRTGSSRRLCYRCSASFGCKLAFVRSTLRGHSESRKRSLATTSPGRVGWTCSNCAKYAISLASLFQTSCGSSRSAFSRSDRSIWFRTCPAVRASPRVPRRPSWRVRNALAARGLEPRSERGSCVVLASAMQPPSCRHGFLVYESNPGPPAEVFSSPYQQLSPWEDERQEKRLIYLGGPMII
jgi:hypothetical protein